MHGTVRTPGECFTDLSDFSDEPNDVQVDGLPMHYVDEGPKDGEIVMMLHGQPDGSYLYRTMIPPIIAAG